MNTEEILRPYRDRINDLDRDLIDTLGERLRVCLEVGHIKKRHGIAMMQPARVETVKDRCATVGQEHGLRPDFIRTLYDLIIQEACDLETIIIDEKA